MTPAQSQERDTFLQRLTPAGWTANDINENFDEGRWLPYEATLLYKGAKAEFRADLHIGKQMLILFVYSTRETRLELDFMYEGTLAALLDAIVQVQDTMSATAPGPFINTLLDACPECYTYTTDEQKRRVTKTDDAAAS